MFLLHLDGDEHEDSYYRLNTMTVFGFGRTLRESRTGNLLTATPNRFVVGFVEATEHPDVVRAIDAVQRSVNVEIGTWRTNR